MRFRSLTLGLLATVASVVGASPQTAVALSPRATASELAKAMRPAGGGSGALVVDADTGERVYAARPQTTRLPASVEKLYTTSAALLRLGPDERLSTDARAVEPLGIDGTLDGDLYLRGTGDPTLTTKGLAVLARSVVSRTGLSRVTGQVVGDDSAFDRLRGVPSAGFRISVDVEPLGALMVNRGRTGLASPYYQSDPAAWAATKFAAALREAGVKMKKAGAVGRTPPGALTLASRRSPDLARLVRLANVPSDNYVAEMLLKVVGASDGSTGTTARGAALAEATLSDAFGVHPNIVDGSGLSRADRTSPAQVVRLLTRIRQRDEGPVLHDSLAVMGRSGTLRDRLRSSAARDRCRGKTGTLRDVSNLAGYCETADGTTLAFAILMNGVRPYSARRLQDRMVSAIARYEPAG
jgi:D-alanyl-D-alanine carboxypeptidase/D-alanyl-D-alanine-endopeptidase (penicillin-binding protein 4)